MSLLTESLADGPHVGTDRPPLRAIKAPMLCQHGHDFLVLSAPGKRQGRPLMSDHIGPRSALQQQSDHRFESSFRCAQTCERSVIRRVQEQGPIRQHWVDVVPQGELGRPTARLYLADKPTAKSPLYDTAFAVISAFPRTRTLSE
jgi:hypothetical protein